MPMNGELLSLRNRWFRAAVANSQRRRLRGLDVRFASPSYLFATKLEAYRDRGARDPMASHDLEDIVALVDGLDGLVAEVQAAAADVRRYIAAEISSLLDLDGIASLLAGHLRPDAGSQARLPLVLARLQRLAGR